MMSEQWPHRRFGDCADFVRGPFGGSLKKSMFVESGYAVYEQRHAIRNQFENVRYFIDEEKFQEMKRFELKPNDLIMSCSGTIGKIAIVPSKIVPGIINQALLKITPHDYLLSDYLSYFISSPNFQTSLIESSAGVAIKNVASVKILKEIQIPVPPLEEQQRIVSVLDDVFERIETNLFNSKEGWDNAKMLFKSKLTHNFNEMNVEYVYRKILDVTSLVTDGKHGNCVNEENSGFYFLSAKDVKDGRLHYENARQITKEDFEETHRRTNLEPGDILLTNAGTIGRTAIASTDEKTYKTTFQKSVAVIKPIKEMIDSEYCIFHLRADLDKLVNVSAGAAQKNLLLRDIRSHTIKCPTLGEQRKIVIYLNKFERNTQLLENNYFGKLEKMAELKQSLLQEAFNGNLPKEIAA